MSAIRCLLFLLLTLYFSKGENVSPEMEIKDEDTDYQLLCSNPDNRIDFSSLRISKIGNFLSNSLIKCLDFTGTGIDNLESNAFDNLPNLKYLKMSSNNFDLDKVFQNNFNELEILILNSVPTKGYQSYLTINGVYPMIRKLFLKNSDIKRTRITSKYTFPSLTHLYLSENRIDKDSFDWFPESLEYLDLSGHNLRSLTLNNLRKLKLLFIDSPYEKRLTDLNFKNLDNLKYLSVPSNRINKISSSTFVNTTSLLYLDLSDNDINYIEGGALDSMQNLRFLNISHNKIDIIQGGTFDKLSNLETLVLENNKITAFPMISKEIKLEALMLNCNKIKSIVGGTFIKMPHLKLLYLHENEISYIDQQAFAGLVNLKTLTLTNNKLSILPYNWILSMTVLEELDLSGNRFKDFGNLALSKSSKLKNLYLSKQIQFIEARTLSTVPENVTISFDENFMFIQTCTDQSTDQYRRYYG